MASMPDDYWWVLGLPVTAAAWHSNPAAVLLAVAAASAALVLLGRWRSRGGSAWSRHGGGGGHSAAPPGPSGWPLLGMLPLMSGGLAHVRLARLARRYDGAERLMGLSLGATPVAISSHPEVARELLNHAALADRPLKESARELMFHRALGFAPYGDHWRRLRRLCSTHLFCPRRIAAFRGHRDAIAERLVDRIGAAADGRVTVRAELRRAALDNIMVLVFGRSYYASAGGAADAERAELSALVDECYHVLGKLNWADHLPLLRFLDIQGVRRRSAALLPRVRAFVGNIVREHRDAGALADDRPEADFVDVLLGLGHQQGLSDDDMMALLWEMIFRGTDTVAIVLEWTLARMVRHRQVQQRAFEEIRAASSAAETPEYLSAVVKEVLRLHPPGPLLSWARLSTEEVHVDGHALPAGTTAMVNMWAITHDDKVWRSAGEFRPERFVPGAGGEDVNIMGNDLRLAPFGSGRRVCPGKALAMATVHEWVCRLLRGFEWLPLPGCPPPDLSELLRLSCEMRVPLCARAVPRPRPAAAEKKNM